jgi:colanic acid/amylovoran biosynthesis protein
MKKILITHVQNTLNYGSAMMAINLLYGLRKHFSSDDLEIYCECDEYHLKRLKVATSDNSLQSYSPPKEQLKTKFDVINKYLFGKSRRVDAISSEFDVMIVLGGDDLSETYMRGAIFKGAVYHHINKRCKVILAGQSLGPFDGIYKHIASYVFKNITVITRDDNSYDFTSNKLKIKNVLKSRDLALSTLPKQKEFNRVADLKIPTEKKYLVVVPSGLADRYTSDHEGYLETWSEIIKYIIQRYPNYNIVMLSHVLLPSHADDSVVIDKLYYMIKDKQSLVKLTNRMQPAEARAILGGAEFVITGRMHAAVSTIFMGKPAIALAYSEKYAGTIGRGLQLPELIVDCREKQWGRESLIVGKIINKILYIETNYSSLVDKINLNSKICSEKVTEQIDYIAHKIKGKK